MHLAAWFGNEDAMKELLSLDGVDIDCRDVVCNHVHTAFFICSFSLYMFVFTFVFIWQYKNTPLMLAAANNQDNLVVKLLRAGADWTIKGWVIISLLFFSCFPALIFILLLFFFYSFRG